MIFYKKIQKLSLYKAWLLTVKLFSYFCRNFIRQALDQPALNTGATLKKITLWLCLKVRLLTLNNTCYY